MSSQFVKLATDLGSFNNVPVDEALLAIRSGLVGEAEPLRRFGVLINAAAVEAEGLRLGLVKGNEVMTEQQKVQARASLIMQQTTQAQGDATRTAGSYANQMKALKNTITDLATGLGTKLLPAATAVAGGLNDFINKISAADGAGAKFGVAMDALKTIAGKAWDGIKATFNAIDWGAVGQTLGDGLRRAIQFLAGIDYGGILRTVADKVLTTLKSAFSAIDWNAVGKTAGDLLVKALNTLSSFISKVNWNNVGQQLVHGIGVALKALGSYLAGVDYGAVLGALTKGIIAVLKGLAGLLLGIATAIGRAIITGIKSGALALWGGLLGWLQAIPGHIKGVFSGAAGWLYGAGTAVLQGFWDGLKAKWDAVAGWVGGLGSKIQGLKGPESKDATLLTPHGKAIILGLETGMLASWATLAPKINALGGQIISNFIMGVSSKTPEFVGKMAESARAALEAARAVVEGYQVKLGEAFGRLGEYAKRAFEAKTAGMAAAIERTMSSMIASITRQFDAQAAAIRGFQASLTPAELALRQLDETESARSRQSALDTANAALVKAQALDAGVEKEQAVAAAIEAIRQAELANMRVSLTAQAEVERTHRDQAAALQMAFLEQQKATELANLEARKAQELANLEERNRQSAEKLDQQLATLQNRLALHPGEYDKIQKKIVALLNSYGVSFKNSGVVLGNAFAAGIRAAEAEVKRAARALAQAAADILKLKSPAKEGPLSTLDTWWKPLGPMLARQMNSGDIVAGAVRLAGAASAAVGGAGVGSMARPATGAARSGGTVVQNFHFPHYVGNQRELVDAVRTEVRRATARNG